MASPAPSPIHRRSFLKLAGAASLGLASDRGFSFAKNHNDDALLDDLSQRCFQYFADAVDPVTGICKDLIHGFALNAMWPHSKPDGTIVPCAAGGSLMLTPDICIPAMHAMKDKHGDKIWGKYGFADKFNPQTGWVSTDTLGLDVGMTLLAAENLRTGILWKWFMANPEPQKAMKLAGIEKA